MKLSHRIGIVGLACATALPLTACDSNDQKTAAALVQVAGTAVTSLLILENDVALADILQKDFQAASVAVLNWKVGTPAQDVVQALNIVDADLDLIPVTDKDKALINLAIGTVDEIISLFPAPVQTAPVNNAPFNPVALRIAYEQTATRKHHKKLDKPILSAKGFKKAWNEELKKHPELSKAKAK